MEGRGWSGVPAAPPQMVPAYLFTCGPTGRLRGVGCFYALGTMRLGLALLLILQHPPPDILQPVSFLLRKLQGPSSARGPSSPGRQGPAQLCAFPDSFGQGTASAAIKLLPGHGLWSLRVALTFRVAVILGAPRAEAVYLLCGLLLHLLLGLRDGMVAYVVMVYLVVKPLLPTSG